MVRIVQRMSDEIKKRKGRRKRRREGGEEMEIPLDKDHVDVMMKDRLPGSPWAICIQTADA